jgi:hypothetical protein
MRYADGDRDRERPTNLMPHGQAFAVDLWAATDQGSMRTGRTSGVGGPAGDGRRTGSAQGQVAGNCQDEDASFIQRERQPDLVIKPRHNHFSAPQVLLTSSHPYAHYYTPKTRLATRKSETKNRNSCINKVLRRTKLCHRWSKTRVWSQKSRAVDIAMAVETSARPRILRRQDPRNPRAWTQKRHPQKFCLTSGYAGPILRF